jgi:hypothetical protein
LSACAKGVEKLFDPKQLLFKTRDELMAKISICTNDAQETDRRFGRSSNIQGLSTENRCPYYSYITKLRELTEAEQRGKGNWRSGRQCESHGSEVLDKRRINELDLFSVVPESSIRYSIRYSSELRSVMSEKRSRIGSYSKKVLQKVLS